MSDRDTHFLGSAEALTDAIYHILWINNIDFTGFVEREEFYPLVQPLIAQYAYDLLKYVLEETKAGTLEAAHYYFDGYINEIQDLTE